MLRFLKNMRRKRICSHPFPEAWRKIIEANAPYYRCLSPEDRKELQGHVQILVHEKNFEGCGGLEMTDEIRVTIAAHAAILLLYLDHDYYSGLQSIVVYPSSFLVKTETPGPSGLVTERNEMHAGEAWHHGTIVLAWDEVQHSAADIHDGHNVVLHEFAHHLDQQDGHCDGAPLLSEPSRYISWARILGKEFDLLSNAAARQKPTLLDQYGATNPAEFFAVVTECFFENPILLREKHPELYEELKSFYHQDPAASAAGEP